MGEGEGERGREGQEGERERERERLTDFLLKTLTISYIHLNASP